MINYYYTDEPWYMKEISGDYKFVTIHGTYKVQTGIKDHNFDIYSERYGRLVAKMYRDGWLHVYESYTWDGASGPIKQTDKLVKASLSHDVLTQAIALGLLPSEHRIDADKLFHDIYLRYCLAECKRWICRQKARAWANIVYLSIRGYVKLFRRDKI